MWRHTLAILSLYLLSTGLTSAQQATTPPAQKLKLDLIPSEAALVIVAHPHRLLTASYATLWPTEVLKAVGEEQFGFNPLDIEQVVICTGMPQPGTRFGVVLRFKQPVKSQAIATKIVEKGSDETIDGRKARTASSNAKPSVAFIDDRTLIIADRPSLSWIINAKPSDGPIYKLLRAADDSHLVAGYVAVEPLRPMFAQIAPMLGRMVPPEFSDLLDLPMTVETMELFANISGDAAHKLTIDVRLGTANSDTAANVANVLKHSFQNGKNILLEQITEGLQLDNPEDEAIKQAVVKYLKRLGDTALTSLEPKQNRDQVTMNIELKAGIAEAGMLTGLMLPAVQSARNAGRRAQSMNNLKQIALSMHNYHAAKRSFPASASYDANGKPLLSWRVHMLPYLEQQALYEQFHLDEPWDSEHNKKLIEKMPDVYHHPKLDTKDGTTVYQVVVGKGAAFEGTKGLRLATFTDGTSMTVMAIEVEPKKAVPWTKPEDWEFDPEQDVDPNNFGGIMPGEIFHAVYADGHVSALSRSIDPKTLKATFTRNGGEVVPRF